MGPSRHQTQVGNAASLPDDSIFDIDNCGNFRSSKFLQTCKNIVHLLWIVSRRAQELQKSIEAAVQFSNDFSKQRRRINAVQAVEDVFDAFHSKYSCAPIVEDVLHDLKAAVAKRKNGDATSSLPRGPHLVLHRSISDNSLCDLCEAQVESDKVQQPRMSFKLAEATFRALYPQMLASFTREQREYNAAVRQVSAATERVSKEVQSKVGAVVGRLSIAVLQTAFALADVCMAGLQLGVDVCDQDAILGLIEVVHEIRLFQHDEQQLSALARRTWRTSVGSSEWAEGREALGTGMSSLRRRRNRIIRLAGSLCNGYAALKDDGDSDDEEYAIERAKRLSERLAEHPAAPEIATLPWVPEGEEDFDWQGFGDACRAADADD